MLLSWNYFSYFEINKKAKKKVLLLYYVLLFYRNSLALSNGINSNYIYSTINTNYHLSDEWSYHRYFKKSLLTLTIYLDKVILYTQIPGASFNSKAAAAQQALSIDWITLWIPKCLRDCCKRRRKRATRLRPPSSPTSPRLQYQFKAAPSRRRLLIWPFDTTDTLISNTNSKLKRPTEWRTTVIPLPRHKVSTPISAMMTLKWPLRCLIITSARTWRCKECLSVMRITIVTTTWKMWRRTSLRVILIGFGIGQADHKHSHQSTFNLFYLFI